VVVIGVLFSDQIETTLRSLYIVAGALIVGGVVFIVVERLASRIRPIESVTWKDGLVVGIAQALALIPGVSRSGSTIVGGLIMGLDRPAAARFSFLLSVPAVVLSGVYQLKDIGGDGDASYAVTVVAALFAFASGYAAIAFLLRYLAHHSLFVFALYRFAFGGLILVLALSGTIR
jgi:undecaprenyl-diphosphatase